MFRHVHWRFSGRPYTRRREPGIRLPYRYIKHTSRLIRRLGDSDVQLQVNKVTNLRIAAGLMNGIVIGPGQYFSFCQQVGKPTLKRGFLEGMELSFGEARPGVGGGICQLSNLIHWMALHSPLQVVERSNHSFDPFPDHNRVLPFGSGAAIFYNYVDLVLFNPTRQHFQLMFNIAEHQLEGELLSDTPGGIKYHVYQKGERFFRRRGVVYRENEIWRDSLTKGHGPRLLQSECLYRNKVVVKYQPEFEVPDLE